MLARHKHAFALPLCPQFAALSSGSRVGRMEASEESYRLYSCCRCGQQVRICRQCDRGQQYCAGPCAQIRRRESLLRAGARYQTSYCGAWRHAARQRAWRARRVQKVTHHGSLVTVGSLIVRPSSSTTWQTYAQSVCATALRQSDRAVPRCCFCGRRLGRFVRLGPLRAGA